MSRSTEERSALGSGWERLRRRRDVPHLGCDRLHQSVLPAAGHQPAHLHDLPRARSGLDDDGGGEQGAVQGDGRPRPAVQPGRRGHPARRRHLDEEGAQGRCSSRRPSTSPSPASRGRSRAAASSRWRPRIRRASPTATRVLNFRRPTAVGERDQGVEHPEHERSGAGHPGDAREPDERRRRPPRAARRRQQPGADGSAERRPRLHVRHLLRADHRQRRGAPRRGRARWVVRPTCRRSRSRSA